MGIRRELLAALAITAATAGDSLQAQQYDDQGGIRYQVTRQEITKPVAIQTTREQQVTNYRQQVTTENVQHQQVYHVPVTQYQVVSRLHNRWNPFAEPYWTHHYEPVTTWQQQVGTVQIPVSKVAWVPETRTVQTPTTVWQNATQVVETRMPIGPSPAGASGNTAMASTQPRSGSPSAQLSAVAPGASQPAATVASRPMGGQSMPSDPPRYGATSQTNSGWSQQQPAAPLPAQTATQPAAPAPVQNSRY